jgi:hypothetical protein
MVTLLAPGQGGQVGDDKQETNRRRWMEKIAILSSHGLRVLALCRGTVSKDSMNQGDQLKADFVNGRKEQRG